MSKYEQVIGPEDMPLCPFCDNEILQGQEYSIITAYAAYALAHLACVGDTYE